MFRTMLRTRLHTSRSIALSISLLSLVAAMLTLTLTAHADDQSTGQPHVVHHKAHKKVEPLVLPPLPAGPLTQVPLDQLPAAAPQVTYQDGMLAIAAQNATLAEILRDVRQLTGATIEIPPSGANERVVVQLGPGAPRDVLAALLNGTSFNYVMLGSTSNPMSVATVMLSSKPGGEVQTAAANPAPVVESPSAYVPTQPNQLPVQMRPNFRNGPTLVQPSTSQPAAAEDADDDSDADDKDDDSDQPAAQAQPVQPNLAQQQPDNQDPSQPNAGPKTPEQILQMIRDGQRPAPPGMPPNQQQPPQQ